MNAIEKYRKINKTGLDAARAKTQEMAKKTFQKDERLWRPTPDNLGNSYSVIRFLPRQIDETDEVLNYVGPVYSHSFQSETSNSWFIENCPTTLEGGKCPVCEHNWSMFKTYSKEVAMDKTSKTRRKGNWYANIIVIKDSGCPENVGKVMIYKFGKSIFDKIMQIQTPVYEDEKAIYPFDFDNGANFIVKTKKKGGYLNYDDSSFDNVSPLTSDMDKLESILGQLHKLNEFIEPENFKSYDALKTRFENVLNSKVSASTQKFLEDSVNEDIAKETADDLLKPSASSKSDDLNLDDLMKDLGSTKDLDELPF